MFEFEKLEAFFGASLPAEQSDRKKNKGNYSSSFFIFTYKWMLFLKNVNSFVNSFLIVRAFFCSRTPRQQIAKNRRNAQEAGRFTNWMLLSATEVSASAKVGQFVAAHRP